MLISKLDFSPKKQEDPNCTITALNIKLKQARSNSSDLDHSFLPDVNDDQQKTSPHNPAGIILRRLGYYTNPSLEELGMMVGEDGVCYVEDLIIGRAGYGSVFFPGTTNVAELNLDEIGWCQLLCKNKL